MALIINTNLGSINGQRNLQGSASSLSTSMTRLSSGLRVNTAKDDAAGLAIADRMNSQIRGMTVAVRNANDGVSLTQTAEGALGSLTDTLQRMRDLAVQSSSNAGVSASDRAKMQTEFKALNDELIRVVQNSEFNGKKILNGDLATGLNIQVGATTDTNSRIQVAVSNMTNLLTPVTKATLSPAGEPVDATLATTIDNLAKTASSDASLATANSAATLANAAVVAAKAAAASPNDLALAKIAAQANADAAAAIAASSGTTATNAATNADAGLVPNAFKESTAAVASTNAAAAAAAAVTNDTVQAATVTDSATGNALLTTATQLAKAASSDVSSAGTNAIALTKTSLADAVNTAVSNAILTGGRGTFAADANAQTKLADLAIAREVAKASYVYDPLKTQTANDTDQLSFINNDKAVIAASLAVDNVAGDYALAAINEIDVAIAAIDTERSNLGSTQNRFTTTISNLQNGIENQSAAKSRIMDADFAQETANLSRAQILQQAGTAMLAQANQSGQSVMTLLR